MRYNIRKIIKETFDERNDKQMSPTVEWMTEKYEQLNQELFDGALGSCEFKVRPIGSRILGLFSMNRTCYEKTERRLFKYGSNFERIYIDSSNFVYLTKPCISLNSNYVGTEKSLMSTLLHEMCHYYTYMDGFVPKQAHGKEFKKIGAIVSAKSKGLFPVTTLAGAEVMAENVYSDEFIDKAKEKINRNNGAYLLTFELLSGNKYFPKYKTGYVKIVTQDTLRKWELLEIPYIPKTEICRLYKCNNISAWVQLGKLQFGRFHLTPDNLQTVIDDYDATLVKAYNDKNIIPIFRIKFSNGNSFELKNTTKEEIEKALREKFPKWKNEIIQKQMDNPNNYPTNESKSLQKIIESVVDRFIKQETMSDDNDIVTVTPQMNLGIEDMP